MSLAAPVSAQVADENPWLERGPLNIAHQGGEHEVPSDTLYGFKTALPKGVDVLELDVHLTADGHVVALHDTTVDRTTNGSGTVEQMTLAEIKKLDAAYWFVPDVGTSDSRAPAEYVFRGIATGERPAPEGFEPGDFTIPTLDEILTAFPDMLINIELKQSNSTGRFEMAVADLLEKHGRVDDVIVVSFLDHSLEVFKALAPDVHTATATVQAGLFWGSSQGPLPGAPNPRHVALQVPMNLVADVTTDDFVKNANANGLAVHVWTINDRATMEQLLDWGVQGIMTDRPTLLEEILQERGVAVP
ncbi:MAG: glycerophosphodiester phosphodiesterase [Thermoleophilaceae bacterium]